MRSTDWNYINTFEKALLSFSSQLTSKEERLRSVPTGNLISRYNNSFGAGTIVLTYDTNATRGTRSHSLDLQDVLIEGAKSYFKDLFLIFLVVYEPVFILLKYRKIN